ncbi:GGDEF domain-containing protein [Litorilituus sediminis]|uniref:diguanylate cyclase n=1 Tax=Litorilituus sediminis TaxID=718192 RepID=A0A4P6PBD5_9GAMM|nr:tetratricopeptide repeat-containing diguanylate cyclase [Litorilituus sediminis]QBG37002.1 diguanylate cyclase [Litorilituus sediminis]
MIIKLLIKWFLILISFQLVAQEQYKFTVLELEMDRIANEYSGDTSTILEKMDTLLKNTPTATAAERALFMTYDCALRAGLASTLAESRLNDLRSFSSIHSKNNSVRAATALCEANVASFHENDSNYQQAIFKAFLFVEKAELATLRYWISLNIYSMFSQFHDYQNAEKALKVGLTVAKANQDFNRLATTHQLLAELYYQTKQYPQALTHNELAQQATDKISDKWYQGELYTNKAKTLVKLGRLAEAKTYFNQAEVDTKRINAHRSVQFVLLDKAYLQLLLQEYQQALAVITKVETYSEEYDDVYLKNQVLLLKSYYQLLTGAIPESHTNFTHAVDYLKVNNYQNPLLEAWQQRIEIANLANLAEVGYQANQSYAQLIEATLTRDNKAIQTLLISTYENIRQDDEVIAEQKLSQATSQKDQLSENRQMLLIGVLLLAALLMIILIKFVWTLLAKYKEKKAEINRQLYFDPLTQCFNRRYFNEIISKKIIANSLNKKTSYLVAIDIDHFKSFNDTFGHSAGDKVLKELVKNLQTDSRFNDNVVRLGGEEFLIVLPPNENLRVDVVIERILRLVSQTPVVIEDTPQKITISIGYVPVDKASSKNDLDDLMNLADKALYVAKATGRNRAIGVSDLQCPANYIDKILIANENKLLSLTEITPKEN